MQNLPQAITLFFQINPSNLTQISARCFHPDVTVKDENQTHQGLDAVQNWLQLAFQAYQFNADPLEHTTTQDAVISTALVSGNFPNSPTVLTYTFNLKKNLIHNLEITV